MQPSSGSGLCRAKPSRVFIVHLIKVGALLAVPRSAPQLLNENLPTLCSPVFALGRELSCSQELSVCASAETLSCAPALPCPLVCPTPLCPDGKLALPEASKSYFPSMTKHQGSFKSILPQCLGRWIWGKHTFFLSAISLCCCWVVELTPQE